jgi:hypothetical protein
LAEVISQAVFDITRPVKSRSINILILFCAAGRVIEAKAHIPLQRDFEVRRQTGHVGEARLQP